MAHLLDGDLLNGHAVDLTGQRLHDVLACNMTIDMRPVLKPCRVLTWVAEQLQQLLVFAVVRNLIDPSQTQHSSTPAMTETERWPDPLTILASIWA